MKIIARIPDYYDYVGTAYGYSNDPLAPIYHREKEIELTGAQQTSLNKIKKEDLPGIQNKYGFSLGACEAIHTPTGRKVSVSRQWLVVGERMFNIRRIEFDNFDNKGTPGEPRVVLSVLKDTGELVPTNKYNDGFLSEHSQRFSSIQGDPQQIALQLLQIVGHPVFMLVPNGYHKLDVSPVVPNLKNLGVSEWLTPEQCYQDISYALTNLINPNPDRCGAVTTQTDVDRAVAHGFDKRISFRHRK